jgi:long-chain acyl-CoA synthetase
MFPGVPFMFEYFIANPPERGWPAGLRRLVSAGARLPPDTIRSFFDRFGLKIHTFYGASESGGIAYDGSDALGAADTVGCPLPGVVLTFRAEDDEPGAMRRVHVRSAGVAGGYVGEASGEFCDGGFLTGDYGALDAAGRLTLTGRVSSFINVAGRKVQPGEVEDVLRQMPGVRDARVVAAADPQRGEHVAACLAVDPSAGGAINTFTVRRFCSARLAPHKIPRTVVVLDSMPLTARGKTDRRALEERVRATIAGIPQQLC